MSITRFPLTWPRGWRRTAAATRSRARFGRSEIRTGYSYRSKGALTVAQAILRLTEELGRLRAADVILSSNLVVRLDGLPRSGQAEPADPGVAVYFTLKRADRCLACDRWDRVADNIAALAAHVSALRGIERWGVGTVDQAFTGYAALPAPATDWAVVLGVSASTATLDEVEAAFRRLSLQAHPDRGGSHDAMTRLTTARAAARLALGGA